jgi:SAM-dependent methyltransferase
MDDPCQVSYVVKVANLLVDCNRYMSFDPHRFRAAAPHYRGGRISYPPKLIRRVADLVGLGENDRVLDLGCGPGQLAIGFSYFANEVVGVDPEPEMLTIAAEAARGLASNVKFCEGSSFDIDRSLGRFRLVTMGRSFHWMDRPATLHRLDDMVEVGGAITLFGDRHINVPENAWHDEWRVITERYAQSDPAWQQRRAEPSHESVLLASRFSRLERVSLIAQHVSTVDRMVERARSMSTLSRQQIGAREDEVAHELRALLSGIATDGRITEVIEWSALIARRD